MCVEVVAWSPLGPAANKHADPKGAPATRGQTNDEFRACGGLAASAASVSRRRLYIHTHGQIGVGLACQWDEFGAVRGSRWLTFDLAEIKAREPMRERHTHKKFGFGFGFGIPIQVGPRIRVSSLATDTTQGVSKSGLASIAVERIEANQF